MLRIKNFFVTACLISLSCIIGLMVIEVALRVIKIGDDWGITYEANILRNFKFNYEISHVYDHDIPYADYMRDEFGLRDDCSETSNIEILTVGGSTTDQRYVPYEATFQAVLQDRMRSQDKKFGCVTNSGVDGHSTWGHIFAFEQWFPLIPDLKPQFVLLYIGINDANFNRLERPVSSFDLKDYSGIKGFLKRFQIVRSLMPIYRIIQQSNDNYSAAYSGHTPYKYKIEDYNVSNLDKKTFSLSKKNAEAFRKRLKLLLGYIDDMGSKSICVTQPHRYTRIKNGTLYGIPNVLGENFSGLDYDYSIREINTVIYDLCGENTLNLYDYKFSDDDFYDGVHTTAKGSETIGHAIAKFLIEEIID